MKKRCSSPDFSSYSSGEETDYYEDLEELFEESGFVYYGGYDKTRRFLEVIAIEKASGRKVGYLETGIIAGSNKKWLDNIEVKELYRRSGIGTNLIEAAISFEPNLQIPFDHTRQIFNIFIGRCIDNGILDPIRNCGMESEEPTEVVTPTSSSQWSPRSPTSP